MSMDLRLSNRDLNNEVTIRVARNIYNKYVGQKVYHLEQATINGGYERYSARNSAKLVVDLTLSTLEAPVFYFLDYDTNLMEERDKLELINTQYLLDNQKLWMRTPQEIVRESRGMGECYTKKLTTLDEENIYGLYAYYNKDGVLKGMMNLNNYEALEQAMDIMEFVPSGIYTTTLAELGYLTIENQVSWLGESGTKTHAIKAYFRVYPDGKEVYYSLSTWCGGNHWKSREHSPNKIVPTVENCTCLKCQKEIVKRQLVAEKLANKKLKVTKK